MSGREMTGSADSTGFAVGTLARNILGSPGGHASGVRVPAYLFDERHPSRTVARRCGEDVPAAALHDRTREWCATLDGVTNPAVAIFNADGVEFAAALFGALHAGKTVYLPGDMRASTCEALDALGVAFVGSFSDEWHPITVPAATAATAAASDLGALDASTARLVIFTSGTTGTPQALPKQLSQLVSEVETLERMFGAPLAECDVLATVSHQHIYGLLFKILWPLIAQRPFVSESVEFPEELIMHLSHRRSAVVSGPAHLKRLPASLNWGAVRAQVGAVFSSGGVLPLATSAAVETMLACAPIEIYGSSETGGIAWRQRQSGHGELWTPLTGVHVRDSEGRLAVHSPHLPDNDWHVGNDSITMADNGRFALHGRVDRIAKIEGKRVSLAGVETALTGSALVTEARVVVLTLGEASARDELGSVVVPSEAGWAFLRRSDTRAFRHTLEMLMRESIDHVGIPRRWRWVDELPVNAMGKTTNEALARLFVPMSTADPAVHPLEVTPDRALLEIYVSPHLDCLDGHFAKVAVLPGAAQLDWAVALGRQYLCMTEPFVGLEGVKFHRVYTPGPLLTLELQWAATRNILSFRFSSNGGLHSSGRIRFGH